MTTTRRLVPSSTSSPLLSSVSTDALTVRVDVAAHTREANEAAVTHVDFQMQPEGSNEWNKGGAYEGRRQVSRAHGGGTGTASASFTVAGLQPVHNYRYVFYSLTHYTTTLSYHSLYYSNNTRYLLFLGSGVALSMQWERPPGHCPPHTSARRKRLYPLPLPHPSLVHTGTLRLPILLRQQLATMRCGYNGAQGRTTALTCLGTRCNIVK